MMLRVAFAAMVLSVGSAFSAAALPIYNSIIAGGTAVAIPSTSGNYSANSFMTDGTGLVREIVVALTRTGASTGGSVGISLWSNSGPGLASPSANAPNTQLASTTVTAASLAQGQKVNFTWSPTVSTAANTLYWVEVARSGLSTPAVSSYTNAAAASTGGTSNGRPELYRVFASGSGTTTTAPPAIQMCISGDGSCASVLAASEPSALSILGIGLMGVGFACHRRRQPHA